MAVCIALMPLSVFAAGLGKLNVLSGLGEPLKADIELISATPEELFSLTAAIANEEAYAAQGIERPAMHNNIQIELAKNASGNPILKLKTNQAVSDPFLDVLIQVDWASGRLLREYTVLLDPPGYKSQVDKSNLSQPIQAPIAKQNAETSGETATPAIKSPSENSIGNYADNQAATEEKQKKTGKTRKAKPVKQSETNSSEFNAANDYTTKHGDTLSTVAKQLQVEGVNLDQMLVGLYQSNPNAFSGDNMNRLKAGQVIRAPSADELNALSQKSAHAEVKLQAENWNAYRNKLAGMVATSTVKSEDSSKEAVGGKVTSSAADKAAQANTGVKDVVKLSAGDVKDKTKQSASALAEQAKIAKLEDAVAKDKALKEDQEKTVELAKIQANKDLLALKSKQMADLQKLAHENEKPVATLAESKVESKSAPAVAAKEEPKNEINPSPSAIAPSTVETAQPPAKKPIEKAPTPIAVVAKPVEAPTSFIGDLLGNVDAAVLGLGGGALALIGGGWLFLRNKRKRSLANFEQGILTSGGLKANTVFGNTSGGKVDTGDTSFLTDFSQSTNGNMIDTNDVDPIAEAEVYMAYGREAQAEEILKDAILKEPKRYELHLKLLEMYAARKDTAAYETIAGELYTTLGASDPTWAKVAEMGATIEPENPLYKTEDDGGLASEKTLFGQTKNLNPSDFESDLSKSTLGFDSVVALQESQDIDFSMPDEKPNLNEEPNGFDFDLGSVDTDLPTQQIGSETNLDLNTNELDFNQTQDADFPGFDVSSIEIDPVTGNLPSLTDSSISDSEVEERFGRTLPSISSVTQPTKAASIEDSLADMSFDLPRLEANAVSLESPKNNFDTSAAEEIDFDFEIPEESNSLTTDGTPPEIKAMDLSNISFDLDDLSTTTDKNKADEMLASREAPTVESRLINLNLPDLPVTLSEESLAQEARVEEDIGEESNEADTKLELVNAYLEMDDKEGAKELLEEVIKEGGVNQIAKAKELLAKLA